MIEPQDNQAPHSSRGRTVGGINNIAARGGVRDRVRRDQLIQEKEDLQSTGRTILVLA
jgi:hypothetical protein